jgi:hypothetical protein
MKMFAVPLAAALLAAWAADAAADPMGREPYAFPARSASAAVQLQMLKKNAGASQSGSTAGAGSVTQYVSSYTTNSNSVGNWNEITQVLDHGAQGYVGNSAGQTSSGDQGATSTSSQTSVTARSLTSASGH